MGKTIHVSDEVWEQLYLLKLKLRVRSLNDVISMLLSNYQTVKVQTDKTTTPCVTSHETQHKESYEESSTKVQSDKFTIVQGDKTIELQNIIYEDKYLGVLRKIYLDLRQAGISPRKVPKPEFIDLCKKYGLDIRDIENMLNLKLIRERPDGHISIEL